MPHQLTVIVNEYYLFSKTLHFPYGTNQPGFFSYQSAKYLGFGFNTERSQLGN
ncbi:MAG: hypothetical protein V7K90_30855 [Nostoc sp.]|uniref:hypothetical protein n=1 Tax=Nostoc sp. TaxID=1180 RepID=UPI002FF53386